jgi:hypothetical protein
MNHHPNIEYFSLIPDLGGELSNGKIPAGSGACRASCVLLPVLGAMSSGVVGWLFVARGSRLRALPYRSGE